MSREFDRRPTRSIWYDLVAVWTAVGIVLACGCDRAAPTPQPDVEATNPPIPSPNAPSPNDGTEGQGGPADRGGQATGQVPPDPAARGEEVVLAEPQNGASASPSGPPPPSTLPPENVTGLEPVRSDDPQEMLRHLEQIDARLRDLVLAGSRSLMEKDQFIAAGKQLGQMKLRAGEHLANLPTATPAQRKTGVIAQLVALSHLSGLGDVESARQLEELARALSAADDPDLAHQARVVLLGFELQAVQNGQRDDPSGLLDLARGLFTREQDRGFPEFMMLQQVANVLEQMDFADRAAEVRKLLTENYLGSQDPQLRGEAWVILTRDSAELANFNAVYRTVGGDAFDAASLTTAARSLIDAYPVGPTLEHLAKAISQIEYSGFIDASRLLAELIDARNKQIAPSVSTRIVDELIDAHRRRLALLGQQADFDRWLVDLEGTPVSGDAYRGKVILVDVWATWCVPCLKEIPNLRKLYDSYHDQGLVILGVNVDDRASDAREFVDKQRIPWPVLRPADGQGLQSEFAQQYGIKLIPFVALIDRDGRVARLHVRGEHLESAVRELLHPEDAPSSVPAADAP